MGLVEGVTKANSTVVSELQKVFDDWWGAHHKGRAKGGRFQQSPQAAHGDSALGRQDWSTHNITDEAVEEQVVSRGVEQMSVNPIMNGWCNTCLRVADQDHPTNCVMRCHKCQQEGHRLAECMAKVKGSSKNHSQNRAGKAKRHAGKPRGDKKAGNTGNGKANVQPVSWPV